MVVHSLELWMVRRSGEAASVRRARLRYGVADEPSPYADDLRRPAGAGGLRRLARRPAAQSASRAPADAVAFHHAAGRGGAAGHARPRGQPPGADYGAELGPATSPPATR